MRITLVIAGLGGGGAERVCVNLANAWANRGHEATLLTISQNNRKPAYTIDASVERRDVGLPRAPTGDEVDHNDVASIIHLLGDARCTHLLKEVTTFAMLRHEILETKPDVVVSFIDRTNVRVLAALGKTDLPVIAYEATDARRVSLGEWQGAREELYRRAAAVVAPDPSIAQWLAAKGAHAWAIPNPLVAPARLEHESKSERRTIVALSRLSAEKRPECLVRSFASIAPNFPEWDLEIYGNGPQRNTLEHLVEKLAPNRIHFHGFTDEPYDVLANADLFVSASRIEGFGNAIWEAMACGVPVVAMDAGPAVRRLVRHGIDGVIVREQTMAALAEALASLMSDEDRRNAYAARAREVVQRFSFESALEKWEELLVRCQAT